MQLSIGRKLTLGFGVPIALMVISATVVSMKLSDLVDDAIPRRRRVMS